MDAPTDVSIYDTMRKCLNNFFVSLQVGDSSSFNSFLTNLSSIGNTIQTHRHKLKKDTLVAVQDFHSDIFSLSSSILELDKSINTIGAEVEHDISCLMSAKMNKLHISENVITDASQGGAGRSPRYIKPSYTWLLLNLHNPYPPKEVKKDISRQSNCSLKDIDAWFIDARKRIGWNKLRRSHFSNKQEKIIAAANHFFKPSPSSFTDDLSSALRDEMDTNDKYRSAFITLQKNARSLYADRFPELHSLTLDIPPPKINGPSNFFYPTPVSSPEPTLPSPLSDFNPHNCRKRRGSSSEPENGHSHPSKRPRLHSSQTPSNEPLVSSSPLLNLLSPPESIGSPMLSLDDDSTIVKNQVATDAMPIKRKRRLSDADAQRPAKRPHNGLCIPRLQTVSDPLPTSIPFFSNSINEFCRGSLDDLLSDVIPPPAAMEDPASMTVPLDIDLHHYETSPYNPELYLSDLSPGDPEPRSPLLPLDNSESAGFESLCFADNIQDTGLSGIDPVMQFDLVPIPYQLDFQSEQLHAPDDLIFPDTELLSFTPGHHQPLVLPLLINGSNDLHELEANHMVRSKTPVLGSFNGTVRHDLQTSEEQKAKRARVQALREELALYEAEGL